jgi:radical SAM superfamily enzyme YgiQ (UPF0313 family)
MIKQTKIWFCDLTHNQQVIAANSVPLGAGMVAAYCVKIFGEAIRVRIFKFVEDLDRAFADEGPPKVIGFSNYVWNHDLSMSIAKAIRKRHPQIIIISGGPNYPRDRSRREAYLRSIGDTVDFFIRGEGEAATAHLLRRLMNVDYDVKALKNGEKIRHCSYLYGDQLVEGERFERMKMAELPSPYLTGLLDEFIGGKIEPLIQTTRGCPYSCAYCVEGSPEYRRISRRTKEQIEAEFEYVAARRPEVGSVFLADSNFGLFPADAETARSVANVYGQYGWPQFLHAGVAKSRKDRVLAIVRILGGRMRVGATIQTSDPEVLKNIHRENVSTEELIRMTKEANVLGGNTYSELILGLPGDTKEKHIKSVRDVIQFGIKSVRPYTLMLLPGSELDMDSVRRKYGFVSKFRVLPRCFGLYSFGGESIPSVEIEEVSIASNTMSLDEYVECRYFDLFVELFFNDEQHLELYQFVGQYGVGPLDLLDELWRRRGEMPPALMDLLERFKVETRAELWESKSDLEEFAKKPENITRYVNNELGRNLIYAYKTECLMNHLKENLDFAYQVAKDLLERRMARELLDEASAFLEEMKVFCYLRSHRFLDTELKISAEFCYDLPSFFSELQNGRVVHRRLDAPCRLEFYHDPEQVRLIQFHKAEYGDTEAGRTRIVARLPIHKAYRKVRVA